MCPHGRCPISWTWRPSRRLRRLVPLRHCGRRGERRISMSQDIWSVGKRWQSHTAQQSALSWRVFCKPDLLFFISPRRIIVSSLALTLPHPYHHRQQAKCVSVQKYLGREEYAFGFGGFIPLHYMHLEPKYCEVGEDEKQASCELVTVLKIEREII